MRRSRALVWVQRAASDQSEVCMLHSQTLTHTPYTRAHTHTHTHIHTRVHTYTRVHTHTHSDTHSDTNAHHTHTHTHYMQNSCINSNEDVWRASQHWLAIYSDVLLVLWCGLDFILYVSPLHTLCLSTSYSMWLPPPFATKGVMLHIAMLLWWLGLNLICGGFPRKLLVVKISWNLATTPLAAMKLVQGGRPAALCMWCVSCVRAWHRREDFEANNLTALITVALQIDARAHTHTHIPLSHTYIHTYIHIHIHMRAHNPVSASRRL